MPALPLQPDADDDLPLVVLDRDEDLAALPVSTSLPQAAQDYLRTEGITDPSTWAAFRLGTVTDADLHRLLTMPQRRQLRPAGFWLPTFDPRQPAILAGLIRLTPAQHKHTFIGRPAGIAGPVDLDQHHRVVLTTAPLTALRLHQAGVDGVALVEDAAVLAPLLPWLTTKELVIVSHQHQAIAAIQRALGELPARQVQLGLNVPMAAQVAAIATLGRQAAPRTSTPAALTPLLLHRLWQYAQGRMAAGHLPPGLSQTVVLALAVAYGAGFFPDDAVEALSEDERRVLPADLGGSLVLPALDEQDHVVDLALWHPERGLRSLFPTPRGVLGSRVISTYPDGVRVVASVESLVEQIDAGHSATLLVRSPADAAALAARGLRHAEVAADLVDLRAALQAAGIELVAPQAVTLELSTVDRRLGHAIFRAGAVTLVVGLVDGATRTHVVARRDGRLHQDDCDLAVPAQRDRFAQAAARTLGTEPGALASALGGVLLRLQSLGERTPAQPAAGQADDALLTAPDLVVQFGADLTACGWIGDDGVKRLALLTLAGLRLNDPPWLLLRGDRALTAPALALLAGMIPAAHRLVVDRPTAASLARQGDLHQQMLVIDDAASLRAETGTLLWRLQVRGAFAHPVAERDARG